MSVAGTTPLCAGQTDLVFGVPGDPELVFLMENWGPDVVFRAKG